MNLQGLISNLVIPTFSMSHSLTQRKLYSHLCTWSWVLWSNSFKHCELKVTVSSTSFQYFLVCQLRKKKKKKKKNQGRCVWWPTELAIQRWTFYWDNTRTQKECLLIIQRPCEELSLRYTNKELYWNCPETIREQQNAWLQHFQQSQRDNFWKNLGKVSDEQSEWFNQGHGGMVSE